MRVESVMWRFLPSGADAWDGDADVLAAGLAASGANAVAAFEDELGRCVALLETPEFAEAARRLVQDGTGIPIGGTALEFLRCAVVAAGRERFEAVLADPERVAGVWDLEIGESLEGVVEAALAIIDAESDDVPLAGPVVKPPHVSVSTCWGFGTGPDALDQYQQEAADPDESGKLDLGEDLENALRRVVATSEWLEAIASIGCDRLWVMLEYWGPEWESEGVRVQRRRSELKVEVTRDAARLPYVWDLDVLRTAAAAEVAAIVEVVGEAIRARAKKSSTRRKK